MAVHKTILLTLCRLCGSSGFKNEDAASKNDISKDIKLIWDVDVNQDNDEIHPKRVCPSCRLKVSRWKTNRRKKREQNPIASIKLFLPHQPHCDICEDNQWNFDVLINACQDQGFYVWQNEDKLIAIKVNAEGTSILKRLVIQNHHIAIYAIGRKVGREFASPQDALVFLSNSTICIGNEDFASLAQVHKEAGFKGRDGQQVAIVEKSVTTSDQDAEASTIRHVGCELLFCDSAENRTRNLCSVCTMHRTTLFVLSKQQRKDDGQTSKHKPLVQMSDMELRERVIEVNREMKNYQQRNKRLTDKVSQLLKEECVDLDVSEHAFVQQIVENSEQELLGALKEDSGCKLLWEQQKQAHKVKSRQMRWHPAIIRWAIAIHSKSASAYDLIKKSGFLTLPHINTLYRYTHFTNPTTGLNPEFLMRHYSDWKLGSLENHERFVCLLIDEMKIKSGLVFSKSTGKLVGFSDVGTVNEEMQRFERKCMDTEREESSPKLASHVLLYMVRGLTTAIKFPVAYYASVNLKGTQLYETTVEVVKAVKLLGLSTLCITSDGASSNRKLYEILGGPVGDRLSPTYSAENPFGSEKLFFFCDPPHLLKTLRNNFENSNWNRKTRNMMFRKKPIQWTQLIQLQEWDQGIDRSSPGLRLLPKLSYEHLHLSPGLRMKVSLAAQVMSDSVANALRVWKKPGFESTILFISKVNKFFDCLNVSDVGEGRRQRNDNLKPYESVDDPRLAWLEDDFLAFLREWVEEGEQQERLSAKEKGRLCLSRPTITGCHITVRSFIEMTKFLLRSEGVKFVLSDKFNQDPLEEFFGKQRAAGGHLDNPTLEQFGHSLVRNVVAGSCVPGTSRGNVRAQEVSDVISDVPLPKRKCKRADTR